MEPSSHNPYGLIITLVVLMGSTSQGVVAQQATLGVLSNVREAEVLIDNVMIGKTNALGELYYDGVQPGVRRVTVGRNGFRPEIKEQEFLAGLYEELTFDLQEAHGMLLINAGEAGASVFLNGLFVGKTDAQGESSVSIRPGRYRVEVNKNGFSTKRRSIVVSAGLAEAVTLVLEPGLEYIPVVVVLLGTLLLVGLVAFAKYGYSWLPTARFDRYKIVRELGRGGMATVYIAQDRRANRQIALKLMDPGLMHDTDLVRKFIKEGEALERIASTFPEAPVVHAFHYGRENNRSEGRPFVAMELLGGKSLREFIGKRTQIQVLDALEIVNQIALGLAAAHANQIWHRDVTPENIIITSSSPNIAIKLIDFGVAKHEYTSTRTLDGSITGKPPYMSPEQCRGEEVDGRTDIYALGILFYTLITGEPPYVDPNPLMVMRMHEVAPLPELPDTIPKNVRALIYQMLAKDREVRPRTMDEVVAATRDLKHRLSDEEVLA